MKNIQKILLIGGIVFSLSTIPNVLMAAQYSSVEIMDKVDVRVETGEIPYIEKEGVIAPITISEKYVGDLVYDKEASKRTITLSLKGTSFEFANTPTITMKNGFSDLKGATITFGSGGQDAQLLNITLPYSTKTSRLGSIELTDFKVKSKSPKLGELYVQISGESNKSTAIQVAEISEYGVSVVSTAGKTVEVVAGDKRRIFFDIVENMPASMIPGWQVEVSLGQGYFETNERTGEVIIDAIKLNDKDITRRVVLEPVLKEGKVVAFNFEVPAIDEEVRSTLSFDGLEVYTEVGQTGVVKLNVEGRGIGKAYSVDVAKIVNPVSVQVEKINAKVGGNNQVGGKITITETDKKMLNRGIITLKIEEEKDIYFRRLPEVEVTKGDAKIKVLGWDEKEDNLLKIQVTQTSTVPSTIEISNFRLNVGEYVPDGYYALEIGGDAIAPEADDAKIVIKDFLTTSLEGNTNTEIQRPSVETTITKFKVGSKIYTIDGKSYAMDAEPYVQDGRTMVPLRYAAVAAGIDANDVKFANGKITVPGKKIIEMNLGSNRVVADGISQTMVTAPVSMGGRTYVPISELASLLGIEVAWDKDTKTATFTYINE